MINQPLLWFSMVAWLWFNDDSYFTNNKIFKQTIILFAEFSQSAASYSFVCLFFTFTLPVIPFAVLRTKININMKVYIVSTSKGTVNFAFKTSATFLRLDL